MTSRLLIFGVAAALATSTSIAAQTGADTARSVTITGCVERASDVLGDKAESGFVLVHSRGGRGGEQLSPNSGRVFQLDPGSERSDLASELGSILEWRTVLSLRWKRGPFGAAMFARYTPSYDDAIAGAIGEVMYRVSITGQVASAAVDQARPTGTSGQSGAQKTARAGGDEPPTVTVKSVKRTEGQCPAGW